MRWIWLLIGTMIGVIVGYQVGTAPDDADWVVTLNRLPETVGVDSWIWLGYLLGGAVVAVAALATLVHHNRQSKAEFLLRLYESWERMAEARDEFQATFRSGCESVKIGDLEVSDSARQRQLREHFRAEIREVRRQHDDRFANFVEFLTFFELIGHYVKRRYVTFGEIDKLFKGPILSADLVFRDYIVNEWQQKSEVPPGLLSNALYLFRKTRRRENLRRGLQIWRKWKQ